MPPAAGLSRNALPSSSAATLPRPDAGTSNGGAPGSGPANACVASSTSAAASSEPGAGRRMSRRLLEDGDADPGAVRGDRTGGAARLAGDAHAPAMEDQPVRE